MANICTTNYSENSVFIKIDSSYLDEKFALIYGRVKCFLKCEQATEEDGNGGKE